MILINDTLNGNWRLIRFKQQDEQGITSFPLGEDATGSLFYSTDGHVSVHIMKSGRPITIEKPVLQRVFSSIITILVTSHTAGVTGLM